MKTDVAAVTGDLRERWSETVRLSSDTAGPVTLAGFRNELEELGQG